MSLVGDVIAYLGKRRVKCALIGGEALAVHGVARATVDSDVMVASPEALQDEFWSRLVPHAVVESRRGDTDDPLVGLVRIRRRREQTDVIVGRPWVRRMLERTIDIRVGTENLPVVDRVDLILLKLFAAGPQDLLDIRLLLASAGEELPEQIEQRLAGMPAEIARAWRRLHRAPPGR